MVGKIISHYQILEKIGEGGMGVVYLAEDTKLERKVALKVLPKHIAGNSDERKRFEVEAKAAAALNHPNITTIHAIENHEDELFLVMEYIDGKELREIIKNDRPKVENAIDIAIKIADALLAAHENGIVHRDIKSSNIMVGQNGKVKIMDFGLAKFRGSAQLTQIGTTIGTIAYMSPEQARGEDVDHRSDIWSFGVVLYELLSGELPFKGDYEQAVIYSILNEKIPDLKENAPHVPESINEVISKCLQKNKEERYQNISDILFDLKLIKSGKSKKKSSIKNTITAFSFSKTIGYILTGLFVILSVIFVVIPKGAEDNADNSTAIIISGFNYSGDNQWSWLSLAITDMISSSLSDYPSLKLASSQQVTRIKNNIGLTSKNLTAEQIFQIAQESKSDNLITGSIEMNGVNLFIKANIYDANDDFRLTEIEPVKGSTDELPEMVQKLTSRIVRNIPKKVTFNITEEKSNRNIPESLDAYRYYLEGKDAVIDQRHEEAIDKLNKAIKLDHEFVDSYYWLAHEYSIVGDYQKANEILKDGKSFISQLSEDERLRYLSNEAGIENRWTDYSIYLEKLLKIDPFDPVDHARFGWTLYNKFRKIDAGIRELETAIALDSTYSWAYNTLGYAYLVKGDKQKALSMIDKYITLNLTDVDPLDSKAELLFYTGEYDQTIEYCENILAIRPDHFSSKILLMNALTALGKYSDVQNMLQRIMGHEKNPNYISQTYTAKANILLLQDNYTEALKNVNQAVELDSFNLIAHWIKGRVLLKLHRFDLLNKEMLQFEKHLSLQGGLDNRWLLYHLKGEVAFLNENYLAAIDWFEKALKLWPEDRSFYHTRLGQTYLMYGDYTEAEKYFIEALDFNPNNPDAVLGMAQTYENKNQISKAKEYYKRLIDFWNASDWQIKKVAYAKDKLRVLN